MSNHRRERGHIVFGADSVHVDIVLACHILVYKIFEELVGRLEPNLHGYYIGA